MQTTVRGHEHIVITRINLPRAQRLGALTVSGLPWRIGRPAPLITSPRECTAQIRLWSNRTPSFETFQPDKSDTGCRFLGSKQAIYIFRRKGFFISSGVIEAGCKTVICCKQSRMFWNNTGAENILASRCVHGNRRLASRTSGQTA